MDITVKINIQSFKKPNTESFLITLKILKRVNNLKVS